MRQMAADYAVDMFKSGMYPVSDNIIRKKGGRKQTTN